MTPDTADFVVSCLVVTLAVPERLQYLRRSVSDYCRQTHCRKELVIVLDCGAPDTKADIAEHIASLRRNDIRIVDPDRKSLGALRNIARENARGDIHCQWDDDDLHHPQRVERQLDYLVRADCAAYTYRRRCNSFLGPERSIAPTGVPAWKGGNSCALMCRRSAAIRYPETGAESQVGEDVAVLRQLLERDACRFLRKAPHVYV